MDDEKHEIKVKGFEVLEKTVKPGTKSSGRVYLPKPWIGKRVIIVRKDPINEKKQEK